MSSSCRINSRNLQAILIPENREAFDDEGFQLKPLLFNKDTEINYKMSKVPSSFDARGDLDDADFLDKCIKNCKEQPLVPLGTLATCVAVGLAAHSLRIGNKRGAQKWFRYRVAFQGFTIAALVVGGLVYGKDNYEKKKTREEAIHEKAKLREKLWIEELERRDFEAKQRKQRAEWARQKAKEMEEQEKAGVSQSTILKEVKEVEDKLKPQSANQEAAESSNSGEGKA